jgi:hypothetical protein
MAEMVKNERDDDSSDDCPSPPGCLPFDQSSSYLMTLLCGGEGIGSAAAAATAAAAAAAAAVEETSSIPRSVWLWAWA